MITGLLSARAPSTAPGTPVYLTGTFLSPGSPVGGWCQLILSPQYPFGLKAYALYFISLMLAECDPPPGTLICLGFEESSQYENRGCCWLRALGFYQIFDWHFFLIPSLCSKILLIVYWAQYTYRSTNCFHFLVCVPCCLHPFTPGYKFSSHQWWFLFGFSVQVLKLEVVFSPQACIISP